MTPSISFRKGLALGLGLGALAWAPQALAVVEAVVQIETSWTRDSNPYRFGQSTDVTAEPLARSKGTSVLGSDVRGALVIPLLSEDTRLLVLASLSERRYTQFPQINHQDKQLSAYFQWRLTDVLDGQVSKAVSDQLYAFVNGSYTGRDVGHYRYTSGEANLKITPNFQVPLSINKMSLRYDDPVHHVFDRDDVAVQTGLRYSDILGTNGFVGAKRTTSAYPNRSAIEATSLDIHNVDTEVFGEGEWVYSPFTRLKGKVGAFHRSYDTLSSRNFDRMIGKLQFTYLYSPMTRLDVELWSNPGGTFDPLTIYGVSNGKQITLEWRPTPKLRTSLQAMHEDQFYRAAVAATPVPDYKLLAQRWTGKVEYRVTPELRLYLNSYHDRLYRGAVGSDILQTATQVGLEYTFETVQGSAKRLGFGPKP